MSASRPSVTRNRVGMATDQMPHELDAVAVD